MTESPFSVEKDIPGMFIEFIKRYRAMEQGPFAGGQLLINQVATSWQRSHLHDQWKSKKKNFGDFFLNLDSELQIKFLQRFGINDNEDQAYLDLVENKPVAALWACTPIKHQLLRNLLLFFCNHGINHQVTPAISLDKLPAKTKRFGNSKNWGDYILSLAPDKQAFLLGQISAHYELKLKEVQS